jgi:putative endonuclease
MTTMFMTGFAVPVPVPVPLGIAQAPFWRDFAADPQLATGRGTARRRAAETRGRDAEAIVAQRLAAQGFSVLARRLRTGAGEIDLVVADARQLLFVEVKARRSLAAAAHAVSPRQQARLLEAAAAALAAHEEWARPEMRFDVALVAGDAVEIICDALRYC